MANPILIGGVNNTNSRQPLLSLNCSDFVFETDTLKGGLSWSKTANFTPTSIRNRSGPLLTYNDSGPIQINVSFFLVAFQDAQTEINDVIEALASLEYPSDPGIAPPPIVYLTRAGHNIFNNFACVCTNVAPHEEDGPYDVDGNTMVATVSMTFQELCLTNTASKFMVPGKSFTQKYGNV